MFSLPQTQYPDFQAFPLWAFRKTGEKLFGDIRKQSEFEENEEKKEEKPILCRNCRQKITAAEFRIEISGHHRHIFNNPQGIVFEIGCFSSAAGIVNHGVPTSEFTWFPGFSWRFSLCSACHFHLGWQYQSGKGRVFYGLILNHLIQETSNR
jgi:hypothetical protein